MITLLKKTRNYIAFKLIGGVLLVLIIATGFASAYMLFWDRGDLLSLLDAQGKILTEQVAISSIEPLLVNDYLVLEALAELIIKDSQSIRFVKIERKDGEVVAESKIPDINSAQQESHQNRIYTFDIVAPSGERIGRSIVGISTKPMNEKIAKRGRILIIGSVISLLSVSLLLAIMLKRVVSNPLSQLDNFARLLGNGDLESTINLSRKDETGRLAETLDTMRENLKNSLNKILSQKEELEQHKDHLEVMVEERTLDLSRTNLKLHKEVEERIAAQQEREKVIKILEKTQKKLTQLSFQDELTGVANRRRFDYVLKNEWRRAEREKQPFSLLMIDIDYFKKYNDTYGHQAGDACLTRVATAMQAQFKRPGDLLARYGGEEFSAILPNTDLKGADQIAESLHKAINDINILHKSSEVCGMLTISIGISSGNADTCSDEKNLISIADKALYEAKSKGRNRTVGK
jgi:diguanylate cyclase (GGDEF)-like protein